MTTKQRTLSDLIEEIRNLNTEKGWREHFDQYAIPPRTGPWFAAYVALAQSELSEALDAYRDKEWSDSKEVIAPEDYRGDPVRKPIGVGPELADALIRILDMVDIWNVDIEWELERVLAFGWTRPYQHGGRVL